jgi:hypothetical protein
MFNGQATGNMVRLIPILEGKRLDLTSEHLIASLAPGGLGSAKTRANASGRRQETRRCAAFPLPSSVIETRELSGIIKAFGT